LPTLSRRRQREAMVPCGDPPVRRGSDISIGEKL
jgi:hypothetical protein